MVDLGLERASARCRAARRGVTQRVIMLFDEVESHLDAGSGRFSRRCEISATKIPNPLPVGHFSSLRTPRWCWDPLKPGSIQNRTLGSTLIWSTRRRGFPCNDSTDRTAVPATGSRAKRSTWQPIAAASRRNRQSCVRERSSGSRQLAEVMKEHGQLRAVLPDPDVFRRVAVSSATVRGTPRLVVYAHADGSFSVWGPARNLAPRKSRLAYVFTEAEVWDGLWNGGGRPVGSRAATVWCGTGRVGSGAGRECNRHGGRIAGTVSGGTGRGSRTGKADAAFRRARTRAAPAALSLRKYQLRRFGADTPRLGVGPRARRACAIMLAYVR